MNNELKSEYPKLEQTISLIRIAHNGQLYNNQPYWHHPVRVAIRLLRMGSVTESTLYAALCHDLLEDTVVTEADLAIFGYSSRTIQMCKLLTRSEEDSYKEYVGKIISSRCLGTMMVKLADLYENSNNVRFLPPEKRGVLVRYGKSIKEIQAVLGEDCRVFSGELEREEIAEWIGEQPLFV